MPSNKKMISKNIEFIRTRLSQGKIIVIIYNNNILIK
jgi:hypothetical protein